MFAHPKYLKPKVVLAMAYIAEPHATLNTHLLLRARTSVVGVSWRLSSSTKLGFRSRPRDSEGFVFVEGIESLGCRSVMKKVPCNKIALSSTVIVEDRTAFLLRSHVTGLCGW